MQSGEFLELVGSLAHSIHNEDIFTKIRDLLEKLKSTRNRREFLAPLLLQMPLEWENIKEQVWPGDENTQNKNRFPFLQGDIISTKSVLVPGQARSDHSADYWIVKSIDCDIARVEPYCSLSPLIPMPADPVNQTNELKQKFAAAWGLKSDRSFPVPPLRFDTDNEDVIGYIADLSEPGFIQRDDFPLASVVNSLTTTGWILFQNTLHRRASRAVNIGEAFKIRHSNQQIKSFEGLP